MKSRPEEDFFDVARLERDILEDVLHTSRTRYWNSAESKMVLNRPHLRGPINAFVAHLFDDGLLVSASPRDADGNVPTSSISGLTPKGVRRLEEIKYPRRTWLKANWFPMVVAIVATTVGIASIVSDWVRG